MVIAFLKKGGEILYKRMWEPEQHLILVKCVGRQGLLTDASA